MAIREGNLFESAIAGLPRRSAITKGRSRSVFERIDSLPVSDGGGAMNSYNYGPASRGRKVMRASPYRRRVTIESSGPSNRNNRREVWRHDRFGGEGLPMQPQSTVFVRGLMKDVSDEALRNLFENAGCAVCLIKIERAPLTTAVVGFQRRDAAARAVEKLHGAKLMGARVKIMIWNRDDSSAIKASQQRQEQDREEEAAMRNELRALRGKGGAESKLVWGKQQLPQASRNRQVTMAHQAPKQSVFERVS